MKKIAVIASLLMALTTGIFAAPAGPGDWSKVRLYGHDYNITSGLSSGWTPSQLQIIQNNFQLFTTEKRHARDYYGSPSTERASSYASRVYYNRNPNIKTLLYWNSIVVFDDTFESVNYAFTNGYDYFEPKTGANWPRPYQYKWSNPDCGDWWVNVANSYVDAPASQARISGVFVDAIPKAEAAGYGNHLKAAMSGLHGLVIYNGFRVVGTNLQAGASYLDYADGVYVEEFLYDNFTPDERRLLIDSLLAVAETKTNKYIICRGTTNNLTDTLAAYLIVANDYTFYKFGDYDQAGVDDIPNHPEFTNALGPQTIALRKHDGRYRREFQHCVAIWDSNDPSKSSITWR